MVFADSSGLIAAFIPGEAQHRRALDAWRAIAARRQRILTSDLVFAETVTWLRRRAGRAAAHRVGEALLRSANIEIATLAPAARLAAWQELARSGDPKLSFCDAASFVLMRERGLETAFTLDLHFRDAGFAVVPD